MLLHQQSRRFFMSLRNRFNDELKQAMIAKNQRTVATIRLILAALKERDIAARPSGVTDGIPDDQILSMMQGMIKQRRDSIEMYTKGNRPDLVQQEQEEIVIIETFLPKQLGEAEVRAIVEKLIQESGATSVKDLGKLMADLKAKYAGQMDFAKASALAREKLA
jgi:uncharacterized protein